MNSYEFGPIWPVTSEVVEQSLLSLGASVASLSIKRCNKQWLIAMEHLYARHHVASCDTYKSPMDAFLHLPDEEADS